MPIYMDRHAAEDATPEGLAAAHQQDLKVQGRFGCKCFTYWFDEARHSIFCLVEAPSRQAVNDMHQAAHGLKANQIIEVDQQNVLSFLGRLTDPDDAARNPIRESGFRAIMFTDIAGSTEIASQLGDDAALELQRSHHDMVREALRKHGGREVDHAGDGFLSSFPSVSRAVGCAIALQKTMKQFNEAGPAAAVRLKIGIGAGEPVEDGDKLFGLTVNLTARICARAKAEQILASPVVRELCTGKLFQFSELGAVQLKGIPGPVVLHEIEWR
jgi:class 3 adenylate cyclase